MSKLKHLLWFLGGVVSVPALILGTAYGSWFMDLINVVDSIWWARFVALLPYIIPLGIGIIIRKKSWGFALGSGIWLISFIVSIVLG